MKLELVPVPVADVDRAKAFYEQAGVRLEVDTQPAPGMRIVQLTPPGSAWTIVVGTGMPSISGMVPGSVQGPHLGVADIGIARDALVRRGLDVGDVDDLGGVKYAGFDDPDGNGRLLQEFPSELRQFAQSLTPASEPAGA